MTSAVGRLIDQWADTHEFRPNMSDVARRVGVSRAAVSRWYMGSAPTPENLRALASLTGIPYSRFADAVLTDLGYLPRESEGRGQQPAANTPAVLGELPRTAHEWDVAAAALRQAGLAESYIVKHIGSRPVDHPPGEGGTAGGIGQARGA